MILRYQSAIERDNDQLLPDGLCWCTQGAPACRRQDTSGSRQRQALHFAAVQGFSPICTSPFCPLPPLSIANSGLLNSSSTPLCVAQGKLAVPVSWRHCSFFPLGCKLPSPWHPTWAIALHGKDAWSSAGKDGGHSVIGILALTSGTATVRGRARHEMCNGCTETSLL